MKEEGESTSESKHRGARFWACIASRSETRPGGVWSLKPCFCGRERSHQLGFSGTSPPPKPVTTRSASGGSGGLLVGVTSPPWGYICRSLKQQGTACIFCGRLVLGNVLGAGVPGKVKQPAACGGGEDGTLTDPVIAHGRCSWNQAELSYRKEMTRKPCSWVS